MFAIDVNTRDACSEKSLYSHFNVFWQFLLLTLSSRTLKCTRSNKSEIAGWVNKAGQRGWCCQLRTKSATELLFSLNLAKLWSSWQRLVSFLFVFDWNSSMTLCSVKLDWSLDLKYNHKIGIWTLLAVFRCFVNNRSFFVTISKFEIFTISWSSTTS